jgi:hypothetical protein
MSASAEVAKGQVEPRRTAPVAVDPVWMLRVELADELPGVMDAREKVATAPVGRPLAARLTALGKVPFCAVAVIVYCAEPPGWIVCGAVGCAEGEGWGPAVPVPLKARRLRRAGGVVGNGERGRESRRRCRGEGDMDQAIRSPRPAWFRRRSLPVATAKSAALVPVTVMPVMFSVALPELVSVALCAALVAPTVAVKLSGEADDKEATGAADEAMPKLAVTLSGALMVTVVEALFAAATLPVQFVNEKPVFGRGREADHGTRRIERARMAGDYGSVGSGAGGSGQLIGRGGEGCGVGRGA